MSFDELIGQDFAVQFLKNCVQKLKISHACLFFGPEGTGKYKAALTLAKALNCALPVGSEPCGKCTSCLKINAGVHPDLVGIKPAGAFIKIDQIKALRKNLVYRPLEGKYRVFIIQNAGSMNRESSNCLLKTLEEPPAQSLIILLANDPEELLPTIISRCQLIRFRPLPKSHIFNQTKKQLSSKEEAEAIAALAGGSLSGAEELMDPKKLKMRKELFSDLAHLEEDNAGCALSLAEFVAGRKELCSELIKLIRSFLRDVMLLKRRFGEELLINKDSQENLRKCADLWPEEKILASWELLNRVEEASTKNYNRQLILENCFLKLIAQA